MPSFFEKYTIRIPLFLSAIGPVPPPLPKKSPYLWVVNSGNVLKNNTFTVAHTRMRSLAQHRLVFNFCLLNIGGRNDPYVVWRFHQCRCTNSIGTTTVLKLRFYADFLNVSLDSRKSLVKRWRARLLCCLDPVPFQNYPPVSKKKKKEINESQTLSRLKPIRYDSNRSIAATRCAGSS